MPLQTQITSVIVNTLNLIEHRATNFKGLLVLLQISEPLTDNIKMHGQKANPSLEL